MKFAIDMDGTCVEHKFPRLGKNVPHATRVLNKILRRGHQLILYTMRSDEYLNAAVKWFKDEDIPLYGIQYDPEQIQWTSSNKCNADIVIDDRNLGIPLIQPENGRPYVDWLKVEQILIKMGIL